MQIQNRSFTRVYLSLCLALVQLGFAGMTSQAVFAKTEKAAKSDAQKPMSLSDRMKPVKEMKTMDDLTRWMTYYYVHPQPEFTVQAILLADQNNLLEGDSVAPFQGFLSKVFEANPQQIPTWFSQLGALKDASKTVLLTAVWWSNTKEGKTLLDNIANSLPEKAKTEFHKQIDKKADDLDKMAIESPDVLDVLWGAFSATGDERYIKRLMDPISWGDKENKDLNKLLISSAASWSIASNIVQHPRVKEICEKLQEDAGLKAYAERVLAESAKMQAKTASPNSNNKKNNFTAETGKAPN